MGEYVNLYPATGQSAHQCNGSHQHITEKMFNMNVSH